MSAVPRFSSETPQTASVCSPLSVSVDRSQSRCGGSIRPHCTPPGERTLFSLLCAAMQPLGTTLYVYGGGWNLDDTGAGREAVTPFPLLHGKPFSSRRTKALITAVSAAADAIRGTAPV